MQNIPMPDKQAPAVDYQSVLAARILDYGTQ